MKHRETAVCAPLPAGARTAAAAAGCVNGLTARGAAR